MLVVRTRQGDDTKEAGAKNPVVCQEACSEMLLCTVSSCACGRFAAHVRWSRGPRRRSLTEKGSLCSVGTCAREVSDAGS